jgi:Subtilase family
LVVNDCENHYNNSGGINMISQEEQMSDSYRKIVLILIVMLIASCGSPAATRSPTQPVAEKSMPQVSIVRHPGPVDYSGFFSDLTSIPKFDINSTDPWQVDLRSRDLTKIDMTTALTDLMYADFDSKTQWPANDKIPVDFDWQKIMEIGKDPGLGIRTLHDQGISGKGVGIAIIDQTLLVDHIEYKDRIRVYEEADDITGGWVEVQMHGPAVASIAVGKTLGVAPEADLYYIATGDCGGASGIQDLDFSCLAKAIQRIVEINKNLPADRKIRVLSMSIGWVPDNKGYDEITAAVNEAKDAGIFVISSSLSHTYSLNFHGLGRNPLSNPNEFQSYEPGLWWQNQFYEQGLTTGTLLVPMDSRTTASPTGTEDYVFYREGGWSWSIPYLAGMYTLAIQVKPEITPEEFWKTALDTGKTIHIEHQGRDYKFGVILDPQALIKEIQ